MPLAPFPLGTDATFSHSILEHPVVLYGLTGPAPASTDRSFTKMLVMLPDVERMIAVVAPLVVDVSAAHFVISRCVKVYRLGLYLCVYSGVLGDVCRLFISLSNQTGNVHDIYTDFSLHSSYVC